MKYWQIASGSSGRDYSEDFIRFGMAFVGGPEQIDTMEEVQAGDRVVLKRGLSEVVAIGEVVTRDGRHRGNNDKPWLTDFDGWNLPAYCFVEWHKPTQPSHVKGLTRGTILAVHEEELTKLADEILATVPPKKNYDPEPGVTKPVEERDILQFLIRQGLRPGAAEELTEALERIRSLANYYYDSGKCAWGDIREHETRTFLTIPLLIALGWAEQQIKIELPVTERKRADVACFPKPYSGKNEECTLLVETKGFQQGLDYADEQAKEYAERFPRCKVIAVSNGFCYKTFTRARNGDFSKLPSGYLNLLKPRDRYPLNPEKVAGCLEVLRLLLPASYS